MKRKQVVRLLTSSICLITLLGILVTNPIVKAQSNSATQVKTILLEDVRWEDNLKLPGIQTAKVIGNPGNPELYVLLNKMSAATILPAHTHPDNRVTTVLSGVVYYGTGKFDSKTAKSYPAGAIIYTPAQTPHYLWAKDEETILQQTGIGATEIDFLQ